MATRHATISGQVTLQRLAISALAVYIGLGMVSNLAFLAAFQFRIEWFLEPSGLVAGGPESAEFLRWAAAADLFSYYLATAVIAYVLWRILRPRSPLVADLATVAALGFSLLGGAAAATLAVVGPALMYEYAATGADHATIELVFRLLTDAVFQAIWQFIDALLIGSWWFGLALLLRVDQPRLAVLQLAIAAMALMIGLLTLIGAGQASILLLGLLFVGWFAWAIWLLVLVSRRSPPFDTTA